MSVTCTPSSYTKTNLIAIDVSDCERMLVILPQLITLHSVALVEFDGPAVGRHVQAQIVRHDLFLLRVGKHLKHENS